MEIIQTHNTDYQHEIIALYLEAFSTGTSKQYIDRVELDSYIETILEKGYALLALEDNHVIGAILCCPLKLDNRLPKEIVQNFSIEKCIYLSEMMVSTIVRGQGIGTKLMDEFIGTVNKSLYSEAFIRVWNENTPALNLYRKMGFEPIATIEQTKRNAEGNGTFVMKKLYLHKKLD